MKFLMIIGHGDDFGPSPELIRDILAWNAGARDRKALLDSNPLKPWQEAKTLRLAGGKLAVTDGTFVASQEKVSAYVLLECSSLDEAVALASRHPMVQAGVVEVRPVWENM